VGFSLIFQYMAPNFARVIAELRARGVPAHFTMGGHYPSFAPGALLRFIPGLDSVVRFEGERTLVGLLDCLGSGTDWCTLAGIAYRRGEEIVLNPLAEPVSDLDRLAPPDRESIDYASHLMPTASVLGSRGCPWNCTFCSIRPFYEAQGGPLRCLRDPHAVASEIRALHRERGVSIFLFQDDDFLAGGKRAKRWAVGVAEALREAGLAGRVAFKISCRSDEIEEGTVSQLMAGDLTHVYMGVESGEEQGLTVMGKRLKPAAHFRAAQTLKSPGPFFDFGFMLLEPYSTIDTVRNNIAFLEAFIGDGWSVSPFCRMLPYAGTPSPADHLLGEWCFAQGLLPGAENDDEDYYLNGVLEVRAYGFPPELEERKELVRWSRAQTTRYLDRLANAILTRRPRIVGCSSVFQQHCASIALLSACVSETRTS
jgi:anaerobic magnesium-protoporphyrin IX monomethyl ester cyclase